MNQITLPAADLKQALSGLSKVVNRKSTLPVLQSIKLSRNGDGTISLSATDLDSFVSYLVEQPQPGKPLDLLLPFEQLNKFVKGSTGDVVATEDTKGKVKVRYQIGDSPLEQSLATIKPEEFPPSPTITAPASKMPANFGETLRQAFEISSTDSSRYVLQGAYLDVQEPKCHSIVSTNGRALFAANTFSFDLKESVNISKQKFLAWSGFLEGECEMAVQANKNAAGYVQFTTPRWNCIVKQIDGLFPKWRQVVPQDTETWTKVRLSEAAVAQILNLASKLPGDDTENRTIQLRVAKELHLEGKNKDDKDFTSAVIAGVNIIGKPITAALNREYLQNAMRCGLDEIRIQTALEPLVFCSPGKRMVVMPVRLIDTSTATAKPAPKTETAAKPESSPATTPETNNERNSMPRTAKPETPKLAETSTSIIGQVEQIKDSLKNVVRDLNSLVDAVKGQEKDKRLTEKEVEAARATLKKLQQVTI
jgi:DNA polymerase III sliding clamp (beta) subunit (PCNA family)